MNLRRISIQLPLCFGFSFSRRFSTSAAASSSFVANPLCASSHRAVASIVSASSLRFLSTQSTPTTMNSAAKQVGQKSTTTTSALTTTQNVHTNGKKQQRIALVWFKPTDMRCTHDHEPMHRAHTSLQPKYDRVLHCFVVDGRFVGYAAHPQCRPRLKHSDGTQTPKRTALATRCFREALNDLKQNLAQKYNATLIIRCGLYEQSLVELCQQYGVTDVFGYSEFVYDEMLSERATQDALLAQGVTYHSARTAGNTLLHVDDLPFGANMSGSNAASTASAPQTPFTNETSSRKFTKDAQAMQRQVVELPMTFTQFRVLVEKPQNWRVRSCEEFTLAPTAIANVVAQNQPRDGVSSDDSNLPTYAELGFGPEAAAAAEAEPDSRAVMSFLGGETRALQHCNDYIWNDEQPLASYKQTRNQMIGKSFSSKFSLYLSNGSLSILRAYSLIKKFEAQVTANASTYWLVFEMLWHDFLHFYGIRHLNSLFTKYGVLPQCNPKKVAQVESKAKWKRDSALLHAWIHGQTGYSWIDAHMREMLRTGWMSNRGRQCVASFLINDLQLDWRLGAEWFEANLIDYDACSNWGNWAYIMGVGADPRSERYFSVTKQSKMYDAQMEYQKIWIPELFTTYKQTCRPIVPLLHDGPPQQQHSNNNQIQTGNSHQNHHNNNNRAQNRNGPPRNNQQQQQQQSQQYRQQNGGGSGSANNQRRNHESNARPYNNNSNQQQQPQPRPQSQYQNGNGTTNAIQQHQSNPQSAQQSTQFVGRPISGAKLAQAAPGAEPVPRGAPSSHPAGNHAARRAQYARSHQPQGD